MTDFPTAALKLLRRAPLQRPLTMHKIGLALMWCALSWIAYGVHLWILASTFGGFGADRLVASIGAIALAMCAGVLVFIVPSGIGVREAVIVAALAPVADSGTALALALTSRLLFTLCEVLAGTVAAFAGSRALRNALVHERSRTPLPHEVYQR